MEVAVVYGSETGTARDLAYRINAWLRRRSVIVREPRALDDAMDVVLENTGNCVVIVVCATSGDGEAPRTMRLCWSRLLSKQCVRLESLRFGIYGLGDARYGTKFNAAARRLDARLTQLGAKRVVDRVLADACVLGGVVAPLPGFLEKFGAFLGVDGSFDSSPATLRDLGPCRYRIETTTSGDDEESEIRRYCGEALSWDHEGHFQYAAKVLENKRLTSEDWTQNVRHIVLSGAFNYASGDVAAVLHRNEAILVHKFLEKVKKLCSMDECYLKITEVEAHDRAPRPVLPSTVKLRSLAERCLDLSAPPTQEIVGRLAVFADDEDEANKLRELASPRGAALFEDYVLQERRSLLEVLDDFTSIRSIELDRFIEFFEWLRPRSFSIASAPDDDDSTAPLDATLPSKSIDLCVALVEYTTSLGRSKTGACSTYLSGLRPQIDELPVLTYKGSFFTKTRHHGPLVLVGPGTGVAPMRAMLQRQAKLLSPQPKKSLLFFGCRHRDHDFLYADDWASISNVADVVVAFSRPSDPKEERAYVTHKLKEHRNKVLEIIFDDDGAFFVAGNVRMATDVRHAFMDILINTAGLSEKDATATLAKLEKTGRFAVEAYG